MAAKKIKELVFAPHGGVSLLRDDKVLWSSDNDPDFLGEFDDVIDPNDEEEVNQLSEYLVDKNFLDENEDFDVTEEYLDETVNGGPGDEEDDDDDEDYDD